MVPTTTFTSTSGCIFWLWLSLIRDVCSLACTSCLDKKCEKAGYPYNYLNCKDDPNVSCLLVIAKYEGWFNNFNPQPAFRSCAHLEYVGKLGGAVGHCRGGIPDSEVKGAFDWLKANPDKKLGGEEPFYTVSGLNYIVCACTGDPQDFDKCNEKVGEEGKDYTVEKKTTPKPPKNNNGNGNGNNNNGNNNNNNHNGHYNGYVWNNSKVGHHFRSELALGGVIILSLWRAVAVMNGF